MEILQGKFWFFFDSGDKILYNIFCVGEKSRASSQIIKVEYWLFCFCCCLFFLKDCFDLALLYRTQNWVLPVAEVDYSFVGMFCMWPVTSLSVQAAALKCLPLLGVVVLCYSDVFVDIFILKCLLSLSHRNSKSHLRTLHNLKKRYRKSSFFFL